MKIGKWVRGASSVLLLALVACEGVWVQAPAAARGQGIASLEGTPAASVEQAAVATDPVTLATERAAPGATPASEGSARPAATPTAPAVSLPAPAILATTQPLTGTVKQVTLVAVGDMMLARSLGAALSRNPQDSPFAAVGADLRGADITVGNLETALGSGGLRARKAYTFLAPPAAVASLVDAGFDVVTLANNHSLDYGPAVLAQGIGLLDAAGIGHLGAGADAAAAHQPVIVTRNGLAVAFLGYVNVPVEGSGFNTASWTATADHPGLAWAQPEVIAADVTAAATKADVVVVLLHSGSEGSSTPNAVQRAAAHAAVDAGALLVIGAHPHVLQGVERYKRGVIVYSLGNFVFDGFAGVQAESAMLRLTVTAAGVGDLSWTPVVLRGGRPQVATGRGAAAILARIERLSRSIPPWP